MGPTCRIAGLAMTAGILGSTSAAAEPLEPLTLEVLVLNEVGMPADTLQEAWAEASRIFELSAGGWGYTRIARHWTLCRNT